MCSAKEPRTSFRQLLDRSQRGDRDAFEQLWSCYGEELERAVRVWLGNSPVRRLVDTLDVCQSVVRRVCQQEDLPRFERPEHFKAYVLKIALNRIRQLARRTKSERRDPHVTVEQLDSAELPPAERMELDELWRDVRRLLSHEEWELFELVKLRGLTWAQAGEQKGAKPDTLRKRLERALERVRSELGLDET